MKVLVVSPYFSPMADVSCVRINSLCTYLLKQGVEITVIRDKNYDHCLNENDSDIHKRVELHLVDTKGSRKYAILCSLYAEVFEKILASNQYDLVLITMGPFSTLPLCEISTQKYGVPCVLDYRDLWIFDVRRKREFLNPRILYRKIRAYPIEKRAVNCASAVVTVTEDWCGILKKVYGKNSKKFYVISNGYDDEQLSMIENELSTSLNLPECDFMISVFGKFAYYSPEYATEIFEAIAKFAAEKEKILINHIGNREAVLEDLLEKRCMYRDYYHNSGFVKYIKGIQMLRASDAVLLVDIRNGAMGTKFYDYVFANKPLIYLGKPNTQLARLVSGFDGGYVCRNAEEVYSAIKQIKDNHIVHLSDDQNISQYSRSIQNQHYFELIRKLS